MSVPGPEPQKKGNEGQKKGKRRCTGPSWGGIVLPLLCLHARAVRPAWAAISTRGMSPEEMVLFSARETFECRYSGKVLPVSRLNDDFCDCPEGTDEPGTSACAYGVFYCANKGHVPVRLPSSRVNDGICDCCDGSDEYDGWVKCVRTCSQAAALGDSAELAERMERELESARLRQKIIWRALHKGKRRASQQGGRRPMGGSQRRKETGRAGAEDESRTRGDGEDFQLSMEEEEEREEEAAAVAAEGGGGSAGQTLGLEVATAWLLLAVLFSVCWARMRAMSRAPWRRRGSSRRLRSRESSLGSFSREASLGSFSREPSLVSFPRVPSATSFPRQARAAQAAIFT